MTDPWKVFLSGVSSEFSDARTSFRDTLTTAGYDVVVQEHFTQLADSDTTLKKLDAYIQECRAVICLVGDRPGALPALDEGEEFRSRLPAGFDAASYTQWELILALEHKRQIFLYLTKPTEGESTDGGASTDDELRRQRGFRDWIENTRGLDRNYFSTLDELKLTYLESQLAQINGQRRQATQTDEGGDAREAKVVAATRRDIASSRRLPSNEHALVGRGKVSGGVAQLLVEKTDRLTLLLGPPGVGKEAVLREITPELSGLDAFPDGAAVSPKLMEPEGIEDLRQAIWVEFYDHDNPSTVDHDRRRRDLDGLDALIFLPEFDEYVPHLEDLRKDLARAWLVVATRESDFTAGLGGEQIAIKPLGEKLSVDLFEALVSSAIFEDDRNLSDAERSVIGPLCRRTGGIPAEIELLATAAKKDLRFDDDPDLTAWAQQQAGKGDVDRLVALATPEELGLLKLTAAVGEALPEVLSPAPTDAAVEKSLVEAQSPRYRVNPVLADTVRAMDDFDEDEQMEELFESMRDWATEATLRDLFDNRAFVIRVLQWGLVTASALDAAGDARSAVRARVIRNDVIEVGRATERAVALGGRHGAWRELLEIVELAALAGGPSHREDLGWARHQRGTVALLRDDLETARRHLFAALPHRRTESARAMTRRNLRLLPFATVPLVTLLFLPLLFVVPAAAATFWSFDYPVATLDITEDALFFDDAEPIPVTVQNVGPDTVRLNGSLTRDRESEFFTVDAGECRRGATLQPGESCMFLVSSKGKAATELLDVDFVTRSGVSSGDERVLLVSEPFAEE